jgi:hypothetical protein
VARCSSLMMRKAYQKAYPKSSRHAAEWGFTRLQKNVEFSARIADLSERVAQGAVMAAQETLERISARKAARAEAKEGRSRPLERTARRRPRAGAARTRSA